MTDQEWTHTEALNWASRWGLAYRKRDQVITKAHAAGVNKTELARRMGLSKSTIARVLESQ